MCYLEEFKSFFINQNKLLKMLYLVLLYECDCVRWFGNYYGKTKHHFDVWNCEYFGILRPTDKKVKTDYNNLQRSKTTFLCWNYCTSTKDFTIKTTQNCEFRLKTMESPLILSDQSVINKVDTSKQQNNNDLFHFWLIWIPSHFSNVISQILLFYSVSKNL